MSSAPLTAHGSQPSDAPPVSGGSQPEKFGSQPAVVADDDITYRDRKDGEDEPSQSRASPAGGAEVWQQIQRKMNDDINKALPKISAQQMYERENAKLARLDAQRQKAKLARLDAQQMYERQKATLARLHAWMRRRDAQEMYERQKAKLARLHAWLIDRRVEQLVDDAENPEQLVDDAENPEQLVDDAENPDVIIID